MRLAHILPLLQLCSRSLAQAGVAVQVPRLSVPAKYGSDRDEVVKIFNKSYTAYREHVFGHDELAPMSLGAVDDFGGWGATIVDSLDTMLIMGLTDFFNEALNFTSHIDFSAPKVSGLISVFETNIRYVGGLLSAYQLSGEQHPILLSKAKEVADKLAFAWVGNNDLPFRRLNFTTNTPVIEITNIAEAGTLTLEWFTLTQFTNNATYVDLAAKSAIHIANLSSPLPGLAAQLIDPASGAFQDATVTWGGGSDSYFEYLLKYARLSNTNNTIFIDTWKTAVDSSIKTLLKTSTVGNHVYLADLDDQGRIRHVGSHLACFHAGNWLLGGKLLGNQTIVDIALQLNDGCWNTYASTESVRHWPSLAHYRTAILIQLNVRTGIGPESFAFISVHGNFTGSPLTAQQLAYYGSHGFYTTDSAYVQRPEVLESNFYAWRITGDTKYLDRAATAIAKFATFLPGKVGFAGLNDVDSAAAGHIDATESFWFAETLKYLYLTFDDPKHISLDDYVFNTECHPLKAPPALDSYAIPDK